MVLGKGSSSGGFFADDQTGDLITYCTKTFKIAGTWSASLLNGTGLGSLHHPNVKVYRFIYDGVASEVCECPDFDMPFGSEGACPEDTEESDCGNDPDGHPNQMCGDFCTQETLFLGECPADPTKCSCYRSMLWSVTQDYAVLMSDTCAAGIWRLDSDDPFHYAHRIQAGLDPGEESPDLPCITGTDAMNDGHPAMDDALSEFMSGEALCNCGSGIVPWLP